MSRRIAQILALLVLAALALQAGLARAEAPQPWNEKAFRAAQATGKPVLVDIYANW